MYSDYPDGKCLIWPEKDARNWDNYSRFTKGDLVLVWNSGAIAKTPAIYFGRGPYGGHFTSVYVDGKLRAAESFDNCVHISPEMIAKSIDAGGNVINVVDGNCLYHRLGTVLCETPNRR